MNKTIIGIIVAIVVIAGGVYLINRSPATTDTGSDSGQENTGAEGRVVFSVTDAAANMSAISEVNMQVSKVEMHNSASGWVMVSSASRTYSLLALKSANQSQVLADVKARAGAYDQVRVSVDSVSVKTKAGDTKEATLPSHTLYLNTVLVVKAGETSSVNFDFLADKSLYTASSGAYVFAPVVKPESRSSAEVNVDANSVVTISGGNTDSTNTAGMDLNGSVKLNFQLDANKILNIDSNNVIKIEGNLLGK